jgi:hypothetical protein
MIETADGDSGGIKRSLKIHSFSVQHWKNELKTSPAGSVRLKGKSFTIFGNPFLTAFYVIGSNFKTTGSFYIRGPVVFSFKNFLAGKLNFCKYP